MTPGESNREDLEMRIVKWVVGVVAVAALVFVFCGLGDHAA